MELWVEALSYLQNCKTADLHSPHHPLTTPLDARKLRGPPASLPEAVKSADWRRDMKCYLQIVRGLHFASGSKWAEVKKCVGELESLVKTPLEGVYGLYTMYLSGVFHQGTGDLETASIIYGRPSFGLETPGSRPQAELEVCLLATFNRIWILQHPEHEDEHLTLDLLEQVRPYCSDHPNPQVRMLWNLVMAAIRTEPPTPISDLKNHISTALNISKYLQENAVTAQALTIMRNRLFQDIVGEQAVKCSMAASQSARKNGNPLWKSVADGMLSQSLEVQGQMDEAHSAYQAAVGFANAAVMTREEGSSGG